MVDVGACLDTFLRCVRILLSVDREPFVSLVGYISVPSHYIGVPISQSDTFPALFDLTKVHYACSIGMEIWTVLFVSSSTQVFPCVVKVPKVRGPTVCVVSIHLWPLSRHNSRFFQSNVEDTSAHTTWSLYPHPCLSSSKSQHTSMRSISSIVM